MCVYVFLSPHYHILFSLYSLATLGRCVNSFVRAFLKTECKTTKTTITLKYHGFNANVIFAFSGLLMNATT